MRGSPQRRSRSWMGGDHGFQSAEPEGPAEPLHEPVRADSSWCPTQGNSESGRCPSVDTLESLPPSTQLLGPNLGTYYCSLLGPGNPNGPGSLLLRPNASHRQPSINGPDCSHYLWLERQAATHPCGHRSLWLAEPPLCPPCAPCFRPLVSPSIPKLPGARDVQ